MKTTVKVSNIDCAQCAKSIQSYFNQKENIEAKVLVNAKKVIFEFDEQKYTMDTLYDGLRSIGYKPLLTTKEQDKIKMWDRIDLMIAVLFSIPLLWTMFHHLGLSFIYVPDIFMNSYFQWAISTPVIFISGRRFYKAFYYQVKAKNLGMDTLVVLGISTAYIYSIIQTFRHQGHMMDGHLYFETSAVIVLMVLIGNYFENRVKEKTNDALQSLVSLGSKEARIIVNGEEIMMPIADVKPGMEMIVLANEKIPLDGVTLEGRSYVDESMLTGESMPVLKEEGAIVIGSSMNLMETLTIKVEAVGSDTVLAKIIQTVEDTALIKPKAQRIADKISAYFVPVVVVLSVLTFVLYYVILNKAIIDSLDPAIAVLVISCPCALGLATPTSISVASGIAFKHGILYKGGEFFEVANKMKAIAFDKTGTLTEGKPKVYQVFGNLDTFQYTASLEKHSNHPLAEAILDYYEGQLKEVNHYEVIIGMGLHGTIDGKDVYVGSEKLLESFGLKQPFKEAKALLEEGKSVFYTVVNQHVVSMVAVYDPIKETAKETIEALKNRGITPYMITGDHEKTALHVANQLGIEHVIANVLPHEKAAHIKAIQEASGITAFVGDGINDAPALKMADVGFAVGSGTDIAIDSSDVTLMSLDLSLVLDAIDLSLATLKNIYFNFFWAFAYNIVMIPLAALGYLNPTLAGIGMGFSSIMVVLNALSLKRFKFRKGNEK